MGDSMCVQFQIYLLPWLRHFLAVEDALCVTAKLLAPKLKPQEASHKVWNTSPIPHFCSLPTATFCL